jgi:ATP-binding cassette subfamily F protein 3
VLRLERVGKIYPNGEVLRDVTWEVKAGDRIGLVGVNGAGKSTQLRIIAGIEEPSSGQIIRLGNPRIAFLRQECDVDGDRTVREELFQAFAEAAAVLSRQRQVEDLLHTAEGAELDLLVEELGQLHSRFESLGGYALDARIDRLLPTLGFSGEDADRHVRTFSGGWQMRMALGKILLQEPDLLLLDEPTNHLDLATIDWLESYLCSLSVALVVVSHDQAFLDRICTSIVETQRGLTRCYLGNYSDHLEQKRLDQDAAQAAFDRQQKDLAAQQAYIDRFRASATRSTQAKSREKLLDKVERLDAPETDLSGPGFQLPPAPRSGRVVARVSDLSHSYGSRILFLGAELEVERGDRIAFVGPNGAGKSTLLRLILGLEPPEDGTAELGDHNVIAGYYEQNQAEALDLDTTVIETLFSAVPDWTQTQVRSLLGGFGFSNEAVFQPVGRLSGGEKARLALALLMVKPTNLLLLDEPTNHLDIPAKLRLQEALSAYEGAVLLVSHDRAFLRAVANRVVELREGGLVSYADGYDAYLDRKAQEAARLEEVEAEAAREARRAANRLKQKTRAERRRQRPAEAES